MLQQQDNQVPERMQRVWNSYVSVRDRTSTDNHIKELMRHRILTRLSCKSVTIYRMCQDLNLNQGNVSLWLKHGNQKAISYANAEHVLDYIETLPTV